MDYKVIGNDGLETENIVLDDRVFNMTPNEGVIYEAVKNELANKRLGTSSSKSRSDVRASTQKPWRQKGTGRARAGMKSSPIWRGGGVAFGPKPRDYSYKLPKKVKRLSVRSILSKRVNENIVRVVEDFNIENGKTKEALDKLLKMSLIKESFDELKPAKRSKFLKKHRLTIITADDHKLLKRACRNLFWVKCLSYDKLNSYDLFYSKEIMIEKSVIGKLEGFYLSKLPLDNAEDNRKY